MRAFARIFVLGWGAASLTACSYLTRDGPKVYRTVITDEHHDPEAARAACERAATLLAKGKLAQAEAALKEALVADVSFAPAHNNLGLVYMQQGNLYLAAWEFEYARRLMPEAADVSYNLGLVYEAADQPQRALECYRAALSAQPRNPNYLGSLARLLIREHDDLEQAALLLRELLLVDTRPEWVAWAHDQLALNAPIRTAAARAPEPEPLPAPPVQPMPLSPPAGQPLPAASDEELSRDGPRLW